MPTKLKQTHFRAADLGDQRDGADRLTPGDLVGIAGVADPLPAAVQLADGASMGDMLEILTVKSVSH